MKIELPRLGHEVTVCADGREAVTALEETLYDCVIVDLDMPHVGGLDVIRRVREVSPDTETVVMTGKSSHETAVAAIREGVFDYLTKPCKLIEIRSVLERVRKKRALTARLHALETRLRRVEGDAQLVGDSPAMQRVRQLIARVGPTDSAVLVRGETGTGKELVARALHESSVRASGPLVAVNCGALPEQLVESELFGHRKGAFTGASEHRAGLFEVADGGTLFLDEIGELPRSLQPRLLRVLETGEIRRVGENEPIRVDCRIVCATHRPLEEMIVEGSFREDLFFRINTFEISLPPLRERLEDLPDLIQHLVKRLRPQLPPALQAVTEDLLATLSSHPWRGNIRELANVIEYALVVSDRLPLGCEHLPERLFSQHARGEQSRPVTLVPGVRASADQAASREAPTMIRSATLHAELQGRQTARRAWPTTSAHPPSLPSSDAALSGSSAGTDRPLSLRELEMQAILSGLERNQGNKIRTAEELGISIKTLYNKLNQYAEDRAPS
jgi:DNA-binding NtrC family response regulator